MMSLQKIKMCLLLVIFIGCKDRTEASFLTVETTFVAFSDAANLKIIPCSCSSNAEITAVSSQPAWCTAIVRQSQKNSAIEITVLKNNTAGKERMATITVSAGNAKDVVIEVKQASATPFLNIDAGAILQFSPQAVQKQFTVSANVTFTAKSSEPSWCKVEVNPQATSGNMTVSVTDYDEMLNERTADIVVVASGLNDTKIKVIQKGSNIKGLVSCNGAGISGVAVSDGYEVTTTGADGVYYLWSQKKNGMVFISIPGNYEPPVVDNIPQFFKRLNANVNTREQIDFELTAVNNERHTILTVADWHLTNQNNDLVQIATCIDDMNNTIDSYQAKGTRTYLLTVGDMTEEYFWYRTNYALPQYALLLKKFKTHVFNVIGNHDHDPYYPGDWIAEQTYRHIIGPNWYSFNLGKVHYAVLDNVKYINNGASQGTLGDMSYSREVVSDQIEWLKKDLANISDKSAPLVIIMHVPLYSMPNINNSVSFNMTDGQQLVDCLSGFSNVLIISGHTHHSYTVDPYAGLMEHNIASVAGSWWKTKNLAGNHICVDGAVGGYGVYEMDGKNIKWHYKSIGYDRNYQFRSYDRNRIHITAAKYASSANSTYADLAPEYAGVYGTVHSGNEVLINVWGYDKNWKIEVMEGSVSLPVTRVMAKDPLHIISYEFGHLNQNKNPGKTNINTSHFFRVTASNPTSTLNIKVTDRFGNVYTETMTRPKELTVNMK